MTSHKTVTLYLVIKYLIIRDASKTFEETASKNILLIVIIDDSQTVELPKHLCDNVNYKVFQILIIVNFLYKVVKFRSTINKENE